MTDTDKDMALEATETKNEVKEKKPRNKGAQKALDMSYAEMAIEAIVELANRSGSSRQAIAKFIEQRYGKKLIMHVFKRSLRVSLKKLVKDDVLKQEGQSFRLSESGRRKPAIAKVIRDKAKAKPKKAKKPASAKSEEKKAAAKPKSKKTSAKPKAKKPASKKPASKKSAKGKSQSKKGGSAKGKAKKASAKKGKTSRK